MSTKINNSLSAGSSAKLRNFAKKFERPAPPDNSDVPAPSPRVDIFERMDLANKLERDNSLDETIDVFPDVRYPLVFIIFNVMKLYKSVTEERPLLTPGSLVSYCLFQLYAFALINDYYGRTSPSFPASAFMNDDTRSQLFEILCSSYVAPFMLTLFHALADCSDPRRPGLQYFCTLAGSRFNIDFGRYIPPQIFLYMHNISTDSDTSRNVAAAMTTLMDTDLFHTQTANRTIRIGNYFSTGTANSRFHASWLYEAVRTLFSPVTGKSLLRRTNIQYHTIATMTIHTAPGLNDVRDSQNQYVTFLNADKSNARNTLKFISAMSNIVKHDLNGSFQLGAVPDDLNGVNILVHGYTAYALPTWQDSKTDATGDYNRPLSDEEYAAAIQFKQPITPATQGTQAYPELATGKADTFVAGLYLQRNSAYQYANDPDHPAEFDPDTDISPRCVYLDPYTNGDGPINYAILAGLIIESEELDGSSVPMPNPNTGLSKINRDFLQGAVPLRRIKHAWHITAAQPYTFLPRTVLRGMQQKISHDLYAIEKNRLGQLDLATTAANFPTRPMGFNIVQHIRHAMYMFSKFSFSSKPVPDEPAFNFVAWSPYRYVQDNGDHHPDENQTYMLLNFRTMYGTHIPLVASRHPNVIIPIS